MPKTTVKFEQHHFEVDYDITPKLSAGPNPDWDNTDDWYFGLWDDIICVETGCCVDDNYLEKQEFKTQILAHYKDNYDPTP